VNQVPDKLGMESAKFLVIIHVVQYVGSKRVQVQKKQMGANF
jgi:hypothetical protein